MFVKVFISSVRRGLAAERDYLRDLLLAVGYEPLRFEDFTAQDRPSRAACLAGVQQADVYVLILGEVYGDAMVDSARSATEEEFTVAQKSGMPIVVFRKDGIDPEPAQVEFERRVGDYQSGRFWKSFTDEKSLGIEVVTALRTLAVPPAALTWQRMTGPSTVRWRAERPPLVDQRAYAPVLEVHVLRDDPAVALLPVGALADLAGRLASRARELGFFDQRDPLRVNHDAGSAWAVRPSEPPRGGGFIARSFDPYAGLAVDRDGAGLAFKTLPADVMGALINQDDLRQRLVVLLRALAPHIRGEADRVALAAAIEPVDQVFEGDPAEVGRRTSGAMRMVTGAAARTEPQDTVPLTSLTSATSEIANELAARLLQEIRATRP